ncbi:MAG TPA: hypothetical protein VMU95_32990 [Trebonia sp.]|nr:hypothetical protein [Trebonia sp.]
MSNWDNDAYYDDDTWFQAVTYDQTDYQDVDPQLEPQPQPSAAPAAHRAGGRDADDQRWDSYAGYDDFGSLATQLDSPAEASSWPQPETDSWPHPEADSRPPAETTSWPPTEADPWPQAETSAWPQPAAAPWKLPIAEPLPPPEADSWPRQPEPAEAWAPGTDPHDEPWPEQTRPDAPWTPGAGRDGGPWRPHAARPSRWLLVGVSTVAAAALGFSVVTLTHRGHQSLPSSALPSATVSARPGGARLATPAGSGQPPITRSQAQQVMAAYTSANNTANAQASQSLLATVEGGGSLAIDEGIYDAQRASHSAHYPAYGPASASYYIPRESPAAYPHWFAVQVTNALASTGKAFNTEYVVFTQAAAGAPWLNSVEPFILPSAALPSIALDASGYATAVPTTGTSLTLPVATASAATATALDTGAGQPASPGNLADEEALVSLRKNLSSHPSITSSHSAATGPVYGLRTTDGGALLFYDVAARIIVASASGAPLHLDIPGFVSPTSQSSQVMLQYLDQLAVNDPPSAQGMPARIVGDYSGLTGAAG